MRRPYIPILAAVALFCVFILIADRKVEAVEFLPTSVEVTLSCGDGLAELPEICDPGEEGFFPVDVGSSTCRDFTDFNGDPFASGTLGCLGDCSGFATSSCYTCGNNHKETVEECDQTDLNNLTCTSLGYVGGSLSCTVACRLNTTACESMASEGGTPGGGPGGGSSGGTSGFTPGAQTERETKVVIYGKSYPNADVHILIDGKVVGIVQADAKADFYFETTEVTPGVVSFGFWSEDTAGLKSTLLSLTFRVVSRAVTTITGVYIAPTINVDKKNVRQGDDITIFGQSVPDIDVVVHINSEEEHVKTVDSDPNGNWQLVFDTEPLEVDFHTAKALFQLESGGNIIKSGFSQSVSFAIGKQGGEPVCPGADLNKDGRVNITDFSILLYYWGTDNECADQDQNGIVDLVDFSIMMFYWTG